jgi:hypothetical protein
LGYQISSDKNKVAYLDNLDGNKLKITSKGLVPSWIMAVYDNEGNLTADSLARYSDYDNSIEKAET